MATIGDPLMDLGTALSYWVAGRRSAAVLPAAVFGLTMKPGMLTRDEVAQRYLERSGRRDDHSSSSTRSVCSRPP